MKKVFRTAFRILAMLGFAYVAILVFLLLNETNLVYPGSRYPRGNWNPTKFAFEEIEFQSSDGTKLVGWYIPNPAAKSPDVQSGSLDDEAPDDVEAAKNAPIQRAILYCHGNGENVSQSAAGNGILFATVLQADLFVFDYRGFGKSEGTPFEAGVLSDSEAALQWLKKRSGLDYKDIILVGHSLGGGPAVHLASKFGGDILILQRTFDRLTSPAQNQYPWLPVTYLMRNQFPSVDKIKTCDIPLFQSHGAEDKLIPIEMGKKLFEASPAEQKEFFQVDGMTHWDPLPASYWQAVRVFVEKNETR
ncbi:MAG: alpha/beta hydrolase [Planctomycetota bacterium]